LTSLNCNIFVYIALNGSDIEHEDSTEYLSFQEKEDLTKLKQKNKGLLMILNARNFFRLFTTINVCKLSDYWNEIRYSGFFPSYMPQFYEKTNAYLANLTHEDNLTVEIHFKQQNERLKRIPIDYGFALMQLNDAKSAQLENKHRLIDFVSSIVTPNSLPIQKRFRLQPGSYLIVPFSFDCLLNKTFNDMFNLVVYSKQKLEVTHVMNDMSIVREFLVNYGVQYSQKIVKCPDSKSIVYMTQIFNTHVGTVVLVVAENKHSKMHFYLNLNIGDNNFGKKLICSREDYILSDWLPPYSRQLIAVIKPSKSDEQYNDFDIDSIKISKSIMSHPKSQNVSALVYSEKIHDPELNNLHSEILLPKPENIAE
jgi:hypothetical protein